VVKRLLDKGAELESKDKYGCTPLSAAAVSGHEAMVKLLLGAGLEPKDEYLGQTPLSLAAANGREVVVKLLLDLLYRAEYDHIGDNNTCEHCDISNKVERSIRDDNAPVIHYGTIASGNQVMKHGATRDRD
jgi:ankyrin repeat protein